MWFSPTERFQRIRDAGVEGSVIPIHADARTLPLAHAYLDAIVCIDCIPYFGTDDFFLSNLARFVKPNGVIAFAGAGWTADFGDSVPEHLRAWWTRDLWSLHTCDWWRRHWSRTGIVDIELADTMPDGWRYWLDWHQSICPDNQAEIEALRKDQGQTMGYIRVVARRRPDVVLDNPIATLETEYQRQPMMRVS
jgi:SAM-dependent methyltransferase